MIKGYDILGNIAIVKFSRDAKINAKKKEALNVLKKSKTIRTVLEKSGKFSGRLRTQKTKFLAGEKTKEALYKENNCLFRLNVDSCYFSPRLSSERKEIASLVKKNEEVLVMFSGVAPFGIEIAKNSSAKRVVCVEIGKECNKYALENVKRNKLNNVEIVQGDVRRVLKKRKEKYDRIVMPRPNLEDSFLDVAFSRIVKTGVIYYYGFYLESEKDKLKELIIKEAKKAGKKIKIVKVKRAGDVGARKYRYRADIKVLN